MADEKIIDLDAITEQSATDLYETSLNGAGSRRETRQQQVDYLADIFVEGPETSTNNALARYDGTTGTLVADSKAIVDDAGVMTIPKVAAGVLSATTQLVGPRASYTTYVSQFQPSVGSGTVTDPYAIADDAFNTYSPGLSIVKFDVGSFALPTSIPVNIVIEGRGQNATTLTGTSLTINQGSWTVSTNPYVTFRNLTIDFTTSSISPTTYKAGSNVTFENCLIKTGIGFANFENLNLINCTIVAPTIRQVNNIIDRGSSWTSTVTITAPLLNTNVPIINFISDDASFASGAGITLSFGNTGTTGVVKLVNSRNKLQTLTYGNTAGSGSSGFQFAFDATSYPVTITSPTSSISIITSIENWAQVLNAYPTLAGNNSFAGQNTFIAPSLTNATVTSLSGNTGTVSAAQMTTAVLDITTTANATWTLPTGSAMDTQLGTPTANTGQRFLTIRNANNFTLTIAAGTGFTLGLMSIAGTLVIPANTSVDVGWGKASTAAYVLYGNSNNPTGTGDVTKTGNNAFSGINSFSNYSLFNATTTTKTTTPGTLTAAELLSGNLSFNIASGATWTFPLGTAIDTALGTPSIGFGIKNIRMTNIGPSTTVFASNTGMNFNGLSVPGSLILGPGGSVLVNLEKTATGVYSLSGSSGVSILTGVMPLTVESPIDGTYPLVRMPFSGTLINVSTIAFAGTGTSSLSINSFGVAQSSNNISTSNDTQSIFSSGDFTAGDYINIDITGSVGLARLLVTIFYSYNITT